MSTKGVVFLGAVTFIGGLLLGSKIASDQGRILERKLDDIYQVMLQKMNEKAPGLFGV